MRITRQRVRALFEGLNRGGDCGAIGVIEYMNSNVIEIGNIVGSVNKWQSPQRGRVYSSEGVSPCIYTFRGGGLEPKILTYVEDNGAWLCMEEPTERSGI